MTCVYDCYYCCCSRVPVVHSLPDSLLVLFLFIVLLLYRPKTYGHVTTGQILAMSCVTTSSGLYASCDNQPTSKSNTAVEINQILGCTRTRTKVQVYHTRTAIKIIAWCCEHPSSSCFGLPQGNAPPKPVTHSQPDAPEQLSR